MATTEHKPSRRAILGALATTPIFAGTIGASLAGIEATEAAEGDDAVWAEGHDSGIDVARSEFARAWLAYWRNIGNAVMADGEGMAFLITEMAGMRLTREDPVPQPELPPHLRLWNNDQRSGAARAMEVLLDSVPGLRDAVRDLVKAGA